MEAFLKFTKEEKQKLQKASKALAKADDELDSFGHQWQHFVRRELRDAAEDLDNLVKEGEEEK